MTDRIIQYISGRELIEKWGVDLVKMWQIYDKGLKAYEVRRKGDFNMPYVPPGQERPVLGQIKLNDNVTLIPYAPTTNPVLMGAVFLIVDIEQFEKDNPEDIQKLNTPQEAQPLYGIIVDGTAPEYLRIAAEAWKALYQSGEHLKWKTGHIKNITAWIKENYKIEKTPAEMIAKIINPNKKGGAPRT